MPHPLMVRIVEVLLREYGELIPEILRKTKIYPSKSRKGLVEMADGGTLFLDKITEMFPPMQVKLLRVIQEKGREISHPGGTGKILHRMDPQRDGRKQDRRGKTP